MDKNFYLLRPKGIVKLFLSLWAIVFGAAVFAQAPTNGLKLHYSFESATGSVVPDVSGNGYDGTLLNSASIGTADGKHVLILGSGGTDYLDMGAGTGALIASLTDFSIAAYVYVDEATDLNANGNFVAVFSNSEAQSQNGPVANGYMYLQAKRSRYAITSTGWCCEQARSNNDTNVPKGKWVHLAYTQSGTQGIFYVDGVQKSSGSITLAPQSLGATAYNWIGRPCFSSDAYLKNAKISDFRIYNRALSVGEILRTVGYPAELMTQWENLTISGNLNAVIDDLTLLTTAGTNGVTVDWESSNASVIATDGNVTRPESADATVVLTAKLKYTDAGKTDSVYKSFNATVLALNPMYPLVADWKFTSSKISVKNDTVVTVAADSGQFVATLKDVAKIRTIGTTTTYNVLDLGNNKGYLDLDTAIGKYIYKLNNYTVGAYFRIDSTYSKLGDNGNFLWNFSNSTDVMKDSSGYIIGILRNEANKITKTLWSAEAGLANDQNAPKGKWHHFAYSQNGTVGTIFLDGVALKTGTVSLLPAAALPITGRTGTNYNWIGRSCYPGDVNLRQTLVYGFQLYSIPVSQSDFLDVMDVDGTIAALNQAYAENPNVILPELTAELANLSLGDISALTADLTLPANGSLDNTIKITWATNNASLLTNVGVVTRPDYINTPVTLTATLIKGSQKVTKEFTATVKAKDGTGYASDLLLSYDFADDKVSGTAVTDAAEKHFAGTLKNGASVASIGPAENKHKVLNLGTDTAYFDMGADCGKLLYGLSDYSVSVYYLANPNKTNFTGAGNFIYTFSNSDSSGTVQNGYMFSQAAWATQCVSSSYWATGNMSTPGTATAVTQGTFHHFAYTQSGNTGTAYLDGKVVATDPAFTNLPYLALAKAGKTGTLYNWLGKSSYVSDAYLAKALLANFQLYKKALSTDEIAEMQTKRKNLNLAYITDSVHDLLIEYEALAINPLDDIVTDIILPGNGTVNSTVVITWASSNPSAISATGVVTRPDYLDTKVILTATLMLNGTTITKDFVATVKANQGTTFASDLILNYNFASSAGSTVIDAAEKHFSGTLMKGAAVKSIGPAANKHSVLDLPSDTAYFDMGSDCGKLLYGLSDYSVSVYFFVDTTKKNLAAEGNIIYNFANSDSSNTKKNGYLFGRASNLVHGVTSATSTTGIIKTAASASAPSKGVFHHMVFTQNGLVGTTYLDGDTVSTVTSFTNLPSTTLPQTGKTGTNCNWLGRSSNLGEAYLGKGMIAEFKLFKKALTAAEVDSMQFTTKSLDAAYNGKVSVPQAKVDSKGLKIDNSTPGVIRILDTPANAEVKVYDVLGRLIIKTKQREISLKGGIYIVVSDGKVAKVPVQSRY